MDDIDFKAKVTRDVFEDLCSDLFDRVAVPVQEALSASEMSLVRTFYFCQPTYLLVKCVRFTDHAFNVSISFAVTG